MVKQESSLQDWIEEVEQEKEKIKNWMLTDRLSIVSKLSFMNGTLAASITGWNAWLMNPLIMEKLTEEELKELAEVWQRLAVEFLELDLKYTKLIKEKQKEARAKKISDIKDKQKQEAKAKATYVM